MPEWLPSIDIAVGEDHGTFLRRMADLGKASGRFDVDSGPDWSAQVGLAVVNFRWRVEGDHSGLGFQLLSRDDVPARVLVEARAERWSPDPPERDTYLKAVRLMVTPLLKAYNSANSTQYRLRIERTPRDRVVPTATTAALLDRFSLLANKQALHPLDWKRFYSFVSESRQQLPEHELRALLTKAGFAWDYAVHLAEIYTHLWAFKRRR